MVKFIYYLILCCTVLLHCCGKRNLMPSNNNSTNTSNTIPSSTLPTGNDPTPSSNSTQVDLQTHTNGDNTLTADEEQKFNTFKSGFDTIITHYSKQENQKTKYQHFITWLENNLQKKKELANAFTIVYDFLEEERQQKSSNLTIKQLIINTINCYLQNKKHNLQSLQCNANNHIYDNKNGVGKIFYELTICLNFYNTNEGIFKYIKDQLLEPNSEIYNLIGTVRYEKAVRKTLNDSQRQGLDFLKAALNNESLLGDFLAKDKNKVKVILEHINNELLKCSGDSAKKGIFKNAIKNYFYIISDQKLDDFKDQVTSGC